MGGVERDEIAAAHAGGDRFLPARVGEDPLDEALAERRVLEAPLLLDRQERQPRDEHARERAHPVPAGGPPFSG